MADWTEDHVVRPRSNEELEQIAEECVKAAGVSPAALPILDFITVLAAKFKSTNGLMIHSVLDSELPGAEGVATCEPPLIRVRQSVYDAALLNEARSRMTLMHECAHILLGHKGVENPRMIAGNLRPAFVKPYEAAERQAPYLAAAILMPRSEAAALSAREIQLKFRVSAEAADIRFKQLARPKRNEPSFVTEFLAKKRAADEAAKDSRNDKATQRIDAIWARAPHFPGEDPAEYRIDKYGYPVRRSRFLKLLIGGWRLDPGGSIISYESERAR